MENDLEERYEAMAAASVTTHKSAKKLLVELLVEQIYEALRDILESTDGKSMAACLMTERQDLASLLGRTHSDWYHAQRVRLRVPTVGDAEPFLDSVWRGLVEKIGSDHFEAVIGSDPTICRHLVLVNGQPTFDKIRRVPLGKAT